MKPHHGQPRRPNIAVTPDLAEPSTSSPQVRYELKAAYLEAVLRAGGFPTSVIGRMTLAAEGLVAHRSGVPCAWPTFATDEITKVFS